MKIKRRYNTKEKALAAVEADWEALKFVSPELRNDREIVMMAVIYSGHALEYASPELRNDKKTCIRSGKKIWLGF